jgi:hypothetical protein
MRWLAVFALFLVAGFAQAQEETEAPDPAPSRPASTPKLGLDRLLSPPSAGVPRPVSTRPGGQGRDAWEQRFSKARLEVLDLQERLDKLQERMRDASGESGYMYSPTGVSETYDPEVLKIRAAMKRDRQSLEAAERRLRDLEVEASLAGVPEAWQYPDLSER